MITIGMYYEVLPGKEELFEKKFNDVIGLLNAGFPGHKESHLYRRVDDAGSYAIISEWNAQDDFTKFMRSDAFRSVADWGKAEILRGRPRHHVYNTVGMGEGPGGGPPRG